MFILFCILAQQQSPLFSVDNKYLFDIYSYSRKMDGESSSGSQIKQPGVGDYIQFAESLKQQCHRLEGVSGISKLERKINAEIKFLESVSTSLIRNCVRSCS